MTTQTTKEGLAYEIIHSPAYATLIFYLRKGQSVVAEAGAMMYMHRTVDIKTHGRKGGVMKGLGTKVFGGESFFVNTFTANQGDGHLALVGASMGDIQAVDLYGQNMILQSGVYLSSSPDVQLDTKWKGLKGYLSQRDFIMLRATGPGTLWVATFGAIVEKDLQPGEVFVVDTGHLVAFPDNIQFSIRKVGGWKSTILSGEGLVTELVGPGKILMQTRQLPVFAKVMAKHIPQ